MIVKHCWICYEHSKIFNDEKAYLAIISFFSKLPVITYLAYTSKLEEIVDSKFWLDIGHEIGEENGELLSSMISRFCWREKDQLDAETFLKLTDASILPKLSGYAAVQLLKLEQSIVPSSGEASTSLQERAIKSLTGPSDNIQQADLTILSKPVLSDIVKDTHKKLTETQRELEEMKTFLPSKVIVSGAGSPAINGTYERIDSSYSGAPRFTMDGVWDGNPVRFDLYLYDLVWYISILRTSEPDMELHDDDIDIYSADIQSSKIALVPPSDKWRGDRDNVGDDPAPTTECIYENWWDIETVVAPN